VCGADSAPEVSVGEGAGFGRRGDLKSAHGPRAKTVCAASRGGADRPSSPLAASEVLSESVPTDVVVSAMSWHFFVNDVLTCSHGHGDEHVDDHDHPSLP